MKDVSVKGHPRSGTHYLRRVVSLNFRVRMSNQNHHGLPSRKNTRKVIYIRRDFEDVAKSIWDLRERFGAGAETFEDFKDTPWKQQFRRFEPSLLELGSHRRRKTKMVKTDAMFKKQSRTPREYHAMHIAAWERCPDVLIVDYEKLTSSFEEEMSRVAEFLGSDVSEFKDIPRTGPWKADSQNVTVGSKRTR